MKEQPRSRRAYLPAADRSCMLLRHKRAAGCPAPDLPVSACATSFRKHVREAVEQRGRGGALW